jgi:hypothetical protein
VLEVGEQDLVLGEFLADRGEVHRRLLGVVPEQQHKPLVPVRDRPDRRDRRGDPRRLGALARHDERPALRAPAEHRAQERHEIEVPLAEAREVVELPALGVPALHRHVLTQVDQRKEQRIALGDADPPLARGLDEQPPVVAAFEHRRQPRPPRKVGRELHHQAPCPRLEPRPECRRHRRISAARSATRPQRLRRHAR